jgi:hypothetical protein
MLSNRILEAECGRKSAPSAGLRLHSPDGLRFVSSRLFRGPNLPGSALDVCPFLWYTKVSAQVDEGLVNKFVWYPCIRGALLVARS